MGKLINEFNEIIRWPKKQLEKDITISWLSEKFKFDILYSEKEVNKIIDQSHSFDDIALLRRELVSKKYLERMDDGSKYWKIKNVRGE